MSCARVRSIAVVCALAGSLLAAPLPAGRRGGPVAAAGPPSYAARPRTARRESSSSTGLGNGGQPDDFPAKLVIAGARFLFDRIVPLSRQDLCRIAQEQETIAYARTEQGPFAAIYLSVPNRSEDVLARYLPEAVGRPTSPARPKPPNTSRSTPAARSTRSPGSRPI